MGLFNRKKKKETKWFVNKKPGNVELCENYIKLTSSHPTTEHIVFYKDIHDLKRGKKFLKITSKTNEYTLTPTEMLGREEAVNELYIPILEKLNSVT